MEPNFIRTDETMNYKGHTMHRIVAAHNFNIRFNGNGNRPIYKGMKGGWIDEESSLVSDNNFSWIFDNCYVYGSSYLVDCTVIGESQINASIVKGVIIEKSILDNVQSTSDLIAPCSILDSTIIETSIDNYKALSITSSSITDSLIGGIRTINASSITSSTIYDYAHINSSIFYESELKVTDDKWHMVNLSGVYKSSIYNTDIDAQKLIAEHIKGE